MAPVPPVPATHPEYSAWVEGLLWLYGLAAFHDRVSMECRERVRAENAL